MRNASDRSFKHHNTDIPGHDQGLKKPRGFRELRLINYPTLDLLIQSSTH